MKNEMPLISVIVPVYNVEKYLSKCVESIINQTYKNLEIILVDDGSTDNSGKLCDEYAENDDRIKVIHKKNGGLSSARNIGLENVQGQWIQFVDSDDYINSKMIEKMYSACKKYEVLMAICGRTDVDFDSGKQTVALCPSVNEVVSSEECNGRLMLWDSSDFSACDKFFNKSLWVSSRFPLGKTSEDIAIIYRVIENAKKVVFISEPFYYYVHRENSITTSSFSDSSFHNVENVEQMLLWVRENCVSIMSQSTYMYIKALEHILRLLGKQPKHIYIRYLDKYKYYSKKLFSYKGFWLKEKFFTMKERIIYIVIVLHIFRPIYKFKKFLRRIYE